MPARLSPLLLALALAVSACAAAPARADSPPSPAPVVACRVMASMPHDADAFTQGLVWSEGLLLESVGGFGVSDARVTDPATGRVLRSAALPADRFGEGLALADTQAGPRLIQLTWRAGEARFLDPGSLEPLGRAAYPGEGWGLTADGRGRLIMSNGSARLTWRLPDDFSVLGRVDVTDAGTPVNGLNELEWVEGLDPAGPVILANVLGWDRIAAIDPDTGRVRFWIDCSGLHPLRQRRSPHNVLNGIAWDARGKRLFVTGKRWPKLFVIEVDVPRLEPPR